jgi:formate C-acetyltransferase
MMRSLDAVRTGKIPVSVEKGVLMTESFRATEGLPMVVRNARALEHVLANVPVFIEPDELIAGNLASKPGAVELSCLWSTWPESELDALAASGFVMDEADRPRILEMNDYWRTRSLTSRMTALYDDQRLWPYAQLGVVLPAFRSKEEGWGPGGMLGCGYGIHHEISQIIGVFQFEKVLRRGILDIIREAEEELAQTRVTSAESVEKIDLLQAIVIVHKAILGFAARFAGLAASMAASEGDPRRRQELERMAAACLRVPAHPARDFHEAMQSLWFVVLVLLPSGVLSFGRFDQFMYPYYQAHLEAGGSDAEVLELLQWLRIKDSQIVITAGHTHRIKYGGLAKWHNCVLGGQRADGSDATNALSYLLLDAARDCPTPHPTLTMRVHADTPDELMARALELVGTGIGVPAFLSDQSCIGYLQSHGVALETARDYAVAGCLGVNIPGQSRSIVWPMVVVPMVLNFAINNGVDARTGRQVGPATGRFEEFTSFDEFLGAFKIQLGHFIELQAEFNNVTMRSYGERFPQPVESSLTEGGIGASKNILGRTMPFENGSVLNPIGMINVADSLTAIRRVVFRERAVRCAELKHCLDTDWAGERGEQVRRLMLAAPKYGNDDDEADLMAADMYRFWADKTVGLTTTYGGFHKPGSITIGTANWPGGLQTGATPDGRHAGEALADESLTPMRGRDKGSAATVLKSAAKIDQTPWQATSLDLRFHPEALAGEGGVKAVGAMIRSYFASGGKHIQFNVVGNDTLRAAQREPERYEQLIVRIGGCSAYFTQLPKPVQDEIMQRTEFFSVDEGRPS